SRRTLPAERAEPARSGRRRSHVERAGGRRRARAPYGTARLGSSAAAGALAGTGPGSRAGPRPRAPRARPTTAGRSGALALRREVRDLEQHARVLRLHHVEVVDVAPGRLAD